MASSALPTLLRLRQMAREESQGLVRRAEDERDAQAAKVADLRAGVARARDSIDPADAQELTAWHAWRLRQELAERREVGRLSQKERELEQKRGLHTNRVRDELAMQNVIQAHEVREAAAEATRDQKRMDELAARGSARSGLEE